ncbi:feline leukemia virus subgroup C receptor-related protein 2-like [Frieseomelitta varia]|uniref:feline leukemia virus subgroup C receptor-related protein 2-like n=1 Tax=Frieseomelitta varia TaxID=561572 RepID=UPI001CB69841|nr:feline leukemia virus subgroup C receptor-related protein 2-like [Frieseomelitta varia]
MTEEKDLNEVLCVKNLVKVVNGNEKSNSNPLETKVYKKRWLILALYILYTGMSNAQWIQYSIIANVVSRYYGVSSTTVDWTAMSFMAYYVIFIFPATYMVDRVGFRWTNIICCGVTCLGSWVKVLSVSPDRFYVTFIGQSLVATTQTIILTLPGRLAAQWFAGNELSTATSLSIFGTQIGIALSFLLTPIIVKNHENLEDIGAGLSHLFWIVAIIMTIAFILVVILFEDDPKLPPSKTRALQKLNQMEAEESIVQPIKRLFKNKSFLLLCNSYGLGIGVLNVVGTLLNQIYLAHFEHGEQDAGRIGLTITMTGVIGSVSFGIILDKTHKYKETTVIVYFLSLIGQISFSMFTWLEMKWMVYLSAIFLGFFLVGYVALGYEMCAEYTYPESEEKTAAILNVANNVYGIVLILIMGRLLEVYGDIPVHVCLCVMILTGFIMTVLTKDVQRRQDARKSVHYVGVKEQSEKSNECNGVEKN